MQREGITELPEGIQFSPLCFIPLSKKIYVIGTCIIYRISATALELASSKTERKLMSSDEIFST